MDHQKGFVYYCHSGNRTDESINIFASMTSEARRMEPCKIYLTLERITSSLWSHFVGQIKSYGLKKKKNPKPSEGGEKYNSVIYLEEEEPEYFGFMRQTEIWIDTLVITWKAHLLQVFAYSLPEIFLIYLTKY